MLIIQLIFICFSGTVIGSFYYQKGTAIASQYNNEHSGQVQSFNWLPSYLISIKTKQWHWQALACELLTGLLFFFSAWWIGFRPELLIAWLLISMLVLIFVIDLLSMMIPNKVLLCFLPGFVLLRFLSPLSPWWSPIAGALAGYFIILLIILVTKGGMGGGDMKLFAVLGIVLGFRDTVLCFFIACLFGAAVGVALQVFRIVKRGQPIPFGPYIAAAALFVYFSGDWIWEIYMGFFPR